MNEIRPACSPQDHRRIDIKAQPDLSSNLWIDVTCRSTKAPSRRDNPRGMYAAAEQQKCKKYEDLAKRDGAKVVGFVVDEYARVGSAGQKLMQTLWTTAETNGMSKAEAQSLRVTFMERLNGIITQASMGPALQKTSQWVYQQEKKARQEREDDERLAEANHALAEVMTPMLSLQKQNASRREQKDGDVEMSLNLNDKEEMGFQTKFCDILAFSEDSSSSPMDLSDSNDYKSIDSQQRQQQKQQHAADSRSFFKANDTINLGLTKLTAESSTAQLKTSASSLSLQPNEQSPDQKKTKPPSSEDGDIIMASSSGEGGDGQPQTPQNDLVRGISSC